MKHYILTLLIVFFLFLANSCDKTKETEDEISDSPEISEKSEEEVAAEIYALHDTFPRISYTRYYIENRDSLNKLLKRFEDTKANFPANKSLITLNRKARAYMKVGDTVLIPDVIHSDMRYYSIFPYYYHEGREIPKIVFVSNIYQCWAAYEYGVLVRFAAANTGKEKTQTYPGRYAMVWKHELRISSLDDTWKMPYTWNIHQWAGSAFHQFTMPGYPASHSCVRQFEDDARWLFKWGERGKFDSNKKFIHLSGTPVIIIDAYDFSIPRNYKWMRLTSNKDLFLELPDNPLEYEEAYIPISQIPEDARGSLPNRKRYLVAEDTLRARGVIREGVSITPSVNFNKLRAEKAKADAKRKQTDSLRREDSLKLYKSDPIEDEQ